jgi:omega-amidase
MTGHRLTVALGEYDTGWHAPKASLRAVTQIVERAAASGARLVVLPEMATTGFTMDRKQAVPMDSSDVGTLRALARDHGIWLIAGVAMREDAGARSCAVNAALAIDPLGDIAAMHRKRRLFAYGNEDASYTSGDSATIVEIDGVRMGLFICYELRFPELFREIAADVDAMVLIANWPAARQSHWDALLTARAIENQCTVVAVNRIGSADGLRYAGGSVVIDAWGERVPTVEYNGVRVASIDTRSVREIREKFPFLPGQLQTK